MKTPVCADNHDVLGIHAVGAGVSELSAAFSLAMEMGARLEDIAGTLHAHRTESAAFHEAALKALGNLPRRPPWIAGAVASTARL